MGLVDCLTGMVTRHESNRRRYRRDSGRLPIDLLVEAIVAVEIKSVERLQQVHRAQLLTYLRLMRFPVGLLINFGGLTLRNGLVRLVNNLPPSQSSRLEVNRHGFPPEYED